MERGGKEGCSEGVSKGKKWEVKGRELIGKIMIRLGEVSEIEQGNSGVAKL